MGCGPVDAAGALKGIGGDVAARAVARPRVPTPRSAPGGHFPRRLRPICARDRWRRDGSPHERLGCCATRPLREGGKLMLSYEEKVKRIELIDAVSDAGRLARGLNQLLESLAHADQLDPLDVEGSWP